MVSPLHQKPGGSQKKTVNTALPVRVRRALGKSTTEEFNETNAELQRLDQQKEINLRELQQLEKNTAEKQRLQRDIAARRDAKQASLKDIEDRKQELENVHGPLDTDAIQKLKDEKRKIEVEEQKTQKEYEAETKKLDKMAKEKQKLKQYINKIRLSKGEKETAPW